MQKRGMFLLFLLALFLSISFISASDICNITASGICTTYPGGHIVMGLSAPTNAHGQFPYSSYPNVLCCYFGTGDTTCSPNPHQIYGGSVPANKIIGLSSSTNAHAEATGGTNYLTNVCYEGLQCINTTSTCPSGYNVNLTSLSDVTNAHIGNFTDFPVKICCKVNSGYAGASCDLTDATWQSNVPITAGLPGYMTVSGNGCTDQGVGASINFSVYKEVSGPDTYIASVLGNYPQGQWTSVQGDNYYFNATAVKSNDSFASLSGTGNDRLTVLAQTNPNPCGTILTCGSYVNYGSTSDSKLACNSDVCNVAKDSGIDSNPPPGYTYGCAWNNTASTCNLTETYGGIPNATILCENGQTLCYNPNTYLKYCYPGYTCPSGNQVLSNGNGICDLGEGCSSVECLDNNQDSCVPGTKCKKGANANEGICYSAGAMVNDTACESGYALCRSTSLNLQYCYPGGNCPTGSVAALSSCANGSASPNPALTCIGANAVCKNYLCSDSTIAVGTCSKSYINTGDTCEDDGFLSYSWTTTWTGSGTRPANCAATGSTTIECPAQIPLPLFTPVNAIITVLAIIGIYSIISLIGHKKHRRKH